MLRTLGEAREIIEIGALNGLFVLGRSVGFIGLHFYRNPQQNIHVIIIVVQQVTISINGG